LHTLFDYELVLDNIFHGKPFPMSESIFYGMFSAIVNYM